MAAELSGAFIYWYVNQCDLTSASCRADVNGVCLSRYVVLAAIIVERRFQRCLNPVRAEALLQPLCPK